jgi:hypothetical protein
MAHNQRELEIVFQGLEGNARQLGLKVNKQKTKYWHFREEDFTIDSLSYLRQWGLAKEIQLRTIRAVQWG